APVQLARDATNRRRVRRIVAVEEIERDAADVNSPRTEPDPLPGQRNGKAEKVTALVSYRSDRELIGIVIGIQRFLLAVGRDYLPEVALLIQDADADHRHTEIAGGLELIAGDVAETTGVDRQRLAQGEFHAEVGHSRQR